MMTYFTASYEQINARANRFATLWLLAFCGVISVNIVLSSSACGWSHQPWSSRRSAWRGPRIQSVLKVVRIHQVAKFQAIPSMRSPRNARNPIWTEKRADGRAVRKTVTVGRMDQRTHIQVETGYFRLRTDERTDEQLENKMPRTPKGGGIKKIGVNDVLVIVYLRSVVFLRNGCLRSIHSRTTHGEANHCVDCIGWNQYHLIVVNKGNYSGKVGSWLNHVMKQWRGRDWETHDVFAVQPWRPVNILVSGKVILTPLKVYLIFLYIIVKCQM